MKISKIVSGAKYWMDERFRNWQFLISEIEKILEIF